MDINAILPVEHAFELVHPATEEPLGVTIMLRSMESDEVRKVKRNLTNEVLRLNRLGKDLKSDDLEDHQQRQLIAAVAGWKWTNEDMTLNGQKKPPFNEKNVRELLKISWIASQIDEQLGETRNFFKV